MLFQILEEVKEEYGFDLLNCNTKLQDTYDGIVLAVSHKEFLDLDITALKSDTCVVFDVKSLYAKHLTDARL